MHSKYSDKSNAHFLEQIAQERAIRRWEVIQAMSEIEERWGPEGEASAEYRRLEAESGALQLGPCSIG